MNLLSSIETGIIRTLTGKKFNIFEPTAAMIDIQDIASGLANKGHFSGFTPHYFSIAEHSTMVCDVFQHWNPAQPDSVKLLALLHDASEAYIGDMVKPLKIHMPTFVAIENRIMEAIAERFQLDLSQMAVIKPTDILIQEIEYNAFFRSEGKQINYYSPRKAKEVFLEMFKTYYHGK